MLNFVDFLKQIVADVHTSGGAVIERSKPSPDLLQRLREYALNQIAEGKTNNWVLMEWFTEGYLDEYVRVCSVHLQKIGVKDTELIYRVLVKVIDWTISSESDESGHRRFRDESFDEQLASSLMLIWDQMGDEQTIAYTFSQERSLINWNYLQSIWIVTGLGKLFLELSPLQAIIFLLSIDSLFSTGVRDFRHINRDILQSLLHPDRENNDAPHLIQFHRDLLYRLGVIQEVNRHDPDEYELTPIGKIALRRALDKDNPLRDAAAWLIENEELGDAFKGSSEETDQILEITDRTHLLNDADRGSVRTSVKLYQSGKYLESLRILYPSIEAVINQMLVDANQQPDHFKGLVGKTQWLEQNGHIPPDVSQAVEVFTGRNRVLHGNFSPPEDYVFPLSLLAFRYLRRLLLEYQPQTQVID